ncbi:hypothetical protein BD779DRAFT_1469720 [Infundibulicybe gibba]|nr:hypothetical protein BD779DRAFT_1469720 [Infundibulicybe gibba]
MATHDAAYQDASRLTREDMRLPLYREKVISTRMGNTDRRHSGVNLWALWVYVGLCVPISTNRFNVQLHYDSACQSCQRGVTAPISREMHQNPWELELEVYRELANFDFPGMHLPPSPLPPERMSACPQFPEGYKRGNAIKLEPRFCYPTLV